LLLTALVILGAQASSMVSSFVPLARFSQFGAKPLFFVVADSISIDYGPALEKLVEQKWQYGYGRKNMGRDPHDWSLDGANGGDSSHVLAYIKHLASDAWASGLFDERLASGTTPSRLMGRTPEVLLLNCGLHDVKCDVAIGGETPQVPLEQYQCNLREIIDTARQGLGAKLVVWVRTTPIVDTIHNRGMVRFNRHGKRVEQYNEAADHVCGQLDVPVIDLHSFTAALGETAYRDNVHFKSRVSKLQAEYLASELEKILMRKASHRELLAVPVGARAS